MPRAQLAPTQRRFLHELLNRGNVERVIRDAGGSGGVTVTKPNHTVPPPVRPAPPARRAATPTRPTIKPSLWERFIRWLKK
jgi:hypothetical protein